MPFFLCQMSLPRPDFLQTMSDEEANLLKSHGDYLQGLCSRGVVICHGPVLDPQAPWGLSIFEESELAAVRKLTDLDPIIIAGTGASYRIVPMRGLRTSSNA